MPNEITLVVSPEIASNPVRYTRLAAEKLRLSVEQIANVRIKRKSIDARGGKIKINLSLIVYSDTNEKEEQIEYTYKDVTNSREVVVVGSGPAGLFAALRLIEHGIKPIVLERGKDVSSRKVDIADLNKNREINPESNYCFGEGGAGTYSDGKLFTRSKKRGNSAKALDMFFRHGAPEEILYEAHPHIGTDRLPRVIKSMRESILSYGGEVRFGAKVTDVIIKDGKAVGVEINGSEKIMGEAVVLATGHSARDIYHLLNSKSILLEAKHFAMGVRIEHPQQLIDSIQYKLPVRGELLPAATYSLVTQVGGRGVYSFCMCPGGFIVPASTDYNQCVVNGMSPMGRNSLYANSAIVAEIREEDYAHLIEEHGVLAGLVYQEEFEKIAYGMGGGAQVAPGQRVADFVSGRKSSSLPSTSYIPKCVESEFSSWLPKKIEHSLREGIGTFGKKMKGFVTNDAMIIGVESRTSSPIRIPRDNDTLEHTQIGGLYPCGEGAGYAGGIISAAVDGERVADKIFEKNNKGEFLYLCKKSNNE